MFDYQDAPEPGAHGVVVGTLVAVETGEFLGCADDGGVDYGDAGEDAAGVRGGGFMMGRGGERGCVGLGGE